ncbi:hypothetical protein PQX77_002964 [Marasmius sp. AFHP31]|nr:hypothetical protein PQX77_002964 [Marasmius sp. AFHP31]
MKRGLKRPPTWKINRKVKKKKYQQGGVQSWGSTAPTQQESMAMYNYTADSNTWQRSDLELSPSKKRQMRDRQAEEDDSPGVSAIDKLDPFADDDVVEEQQAKESCQGSSTLVDAEEWVDEPAGAPSSSKTRKRNQGASVLMAPLLEPLEDIQNAYVCQNFDLGVSVQCSCASGMLKLFRCQQCWLAGVCCQHCMAARHNTQPFHNIERWNGEFFERVQSCDLGVWVYLGHYGQPCPEADPSKFHQLMLVHTTGIHTMLVSYCFCAGHPSHFHQLLDCRFFPGSVDSPKTVFSFKLLGDFHLHTLTSKKTAYHYCDAIQRKTNPVLPHHEKSRYWPFLRAARIHRHLASKRRAGQSHGIDAHLTHRRPGSTAIHCPACPEPGHNIDVKEIVEANPEERHKYTRFFAINGCHSAQRLRKRDDPDDVALNAGSAYFGPRPAFREYVSQQTGEPDPLHCSKLRAACMQNILKFKNAIITGIVGMICTRHGLFYPGGIVDMDRGEGLDYLACVHNVSVASMDFRKLQFVVHLDQEFPQETGEDLLALLKTVTGAIPQGHIDGHNDDCKMKYHYAYTKFVGMTIGELIETPWAMEKLIGGSTMHMNDGHRHDVLDNFHNWWNWLKVQKIGLMLKLKWSKAFYAIVELEPPFEEVTKSFDLKLIEEWERLYAKPLPCPRDTGGEDLFISRNDKRIPSLKSCIDEQLTLERARVNDNRGMDGITDLVVTGINLDMRRCKLLHLASLKNPPADKLKKLNAARAKLLKDVHGFGDLLASYYPSLVSLLQSQAKDVGTQRPEQHSVPLPSSFSISAVKAAGLQDAADIERRLREGQAHDCLEEVHARILTFNHIVVVKKVEVTGQKQHTRILAQRAKWFRDRAALDRWKEEKEILEAEYLRISRAHSRMEEIWKTIGIEYDKLAETKLTTDRERATLGGYAAYARKQACVYARLKDDVQNEWSLWEKVKRRKTKWDKLDEVSTTEALQKEDEEEEWEDTDNFGFLDEEVVEED